MNKEALEQFVTQTKADLLAERNENGHWEGRLSDSALATSVAIAALLLAKRRGVAPIETDPIVKAGLDWLEKNRNEDGGWGDCRTSPSNVSTVALCWAALRLARDEGLQFPDAIESAEAWLVQEAGSLDPEALADTIYRRYGKDRTFAVPILTHCILCGAFGKRKREWKLVKPLPFELATLPHGFFKFLRFQVVSYALPALIAIGHARHHHRPSLNPLARMIRHWAKRRVLRLLEELQPKSGGFLEATPITAFVAMSLAASGQENHPTTEKALGFLVAQARDNGSWPIDANLATWVTTLSINALGASGEKPLPDEEAAPVHDWLVAQQHRIVHPYTQAAPGGWAWTDLSGGVPDADDTPSALLALKKLGSTDLTSMEAATRWLVDLQNKDGGMPTFCRGWGKLPFDRSSPDLTVHAMRAWSAWVEALPILHPQLAKAMTRALDYLAQSQRSDGTWIPLWFGNQHAEKDENPVYGTSRVVTGLAELPKGFSDRAKTLRTPAIEWLLEVQNPDGSWGGDKGVAGSLEETALAIDALASHTDLLGQTREAIELGLAFAKEYVEAHGYRPSPIGLYFAKLWYHEKLYPQVFLVGALQKARKIVGQ